MNETNPTGAINQSQSVPQPAAPTVKKVYEANVRERVLLLLALALGILAADLLLSLGQNWLGLGIPFKIR